jgi:hypothetical protein
MWHLRLERSASTGSRSSSGARYPPSSRREMDRGTTSRAHELISGIADTRPRVERRPRPCGAASRSASANGCHRDRAGYRGARVPHEWSFAKHRTVTALEHAGKLRQRGEPEEPLVEQRSLLGYDQLIA